MRDQIAALIRLRIDLFRHTLTASKAISMVFAAVMLFAAFMLAVGAGIGLFFLGINLPRDKPWFALFATDGFVLVFVFFWLIALLNELQRSELIDLRKMLFLPVSLKMIFLFNFAAATFSPALPLFVLPLLGFCLGLSFAFGPRMLLAIPLGVMFYLMLAAWTYYARGALSILFENKRRRRIILTLLGVLIPLICQVPNIVPQLFLHSRDGTSRTLIQTYARSVQDGASPVQKTIAMIHLAIPPAWFPYGLYALSENRAAEAGGTLLGLSLVTGLGLGLGFRSTWRYYVGAARRPRKSPKSVPAPAAQPVSHRLVERTVPFLDDDTAAATWASFLTYVRQPNLYATFIMSFVMILIFVILPGRGHGGEMAFFQKGLVPFFAIILPFMSAGMFLFNVFGVDRDGFRTLVLLPTDRRKYLLAKNLALLPFVLGCAVVFVVAAAFLARTGFRVLAISLMQVCQLYLLFCTVGNFMSMYFPAQWAGVGMRAKNKSANLFPALIFFASFSVLLIPTAVCLFLDASLNAFVGWPLLSPGIILSAGFLFVSALIYRAGLVAAGRLLMQREQRILEALTRDRE